MTEPTHEQMVHIERILNELVADSTDKYVKGASEHGGKLWEKNVGSEIKGELYDFIFYFFTYKKQVDTLVELVKLHLETMVSDDHTDLTDKLSDALQPFFHPMRNGDN